MIKKINCSTALVWTPMCGGVTADTPRGFATVSDSIGIIQRSYCVLDPVCTKMSNHLWASGPCMYVTSYPDQLSLAIPP